MHIASKVARDQQARSTLTADRPGSRSPIGGWVRGWWCVLRAWRENHAARRRLRQCAALDERFAKDIGLTQDEVAMLCAEPPWRPVASPGRESDCRFGGPATGSPSVLRAAWDL